MPFIRIGKCLNCGISHDWLFEGMSLKELRTVKQLTGMRTLEFAEGCEALDPDAVTAMIYILHERDSIHIRFDDIDVDLKDFDMESTEGEIKEQEDLEKRMQAEAEKAQSPKVTSSGPKSAADSKRK
jgi:hypothetical protein